MKIVNLFPRLVILLLTIMLGATSAWADQQNFSLAVSNMKDRSGTLISSGQGFVQLIKGDPSHPPTGKAASSTPAFSGGDAYAIFADPANYTGQEIKGRVGDFSGFGAGAGALAVSNQFNHSMGTAYYVRYWTADGNYYGSSQTQVPWASGLPVPAALAYSTFTLYKAAAPYAPTISSINQSSSISKSLYPAADQTKTTQLTISFGSGATSATDSPVQVGGDASHGAYELRLKTGAPFSGVSDQGTQRIANLGSPNATINLSDTTAGSVGKWMSDQPAGTTFYAMAVAYNYFGSTASASQSFQLADLSAGGGPVGGGGTATFALVAGINTISIPGNPASQMTVTFAAGTNTPRTATVSAPATVGKLLAAINSAVGVNSGVIGYYDGTAKQHVGLAGLTYATDGSVTGGQAFGSNTAGTAYTYSNILDMSLSQGQALQVSINATGTLTISQ